MDTMEATLVTGRKVLVKELTTAEEELAIRAVGSGLKPDNPASMKLLVSEFVKMMIVEIDGQKVSYQELTEKGLGNYFRLKEIRQLEELYNHIHVPSEVENQSFLTSIKNVSTLK